MLGFFASLQIRPGIFLTLLAEVAADGSACNSSLWPLGILRGILSLMTLKSDSQVLTVVRVLSSRGFRH